MAVCPKPKHKGGQKPPAGDWARYLADERESRERIVMMDGKGRDITPEEMTAALGGENGTYWDGQICPSYDECEVLTERYGGDQELAAREQGKLLAERIGRMNGSEPPMVSIHWDSEDPPKWHYHVTGKGQAKTTLYGEQGAFQRAWDTEWEETEKHKIRDWAKHREYQALKAEGDLARNELRQLAKDRYHSLKGKTGDERAGIRESFDVRERELIEKRYRLEVAAIDARYESRGMVGTARHSAELQNAENRRNGSLDKMTRRENYRESGKDKYREGRALSVANRQARRGARAASKELDGIQKAAEKGQRKSQAGREVEAQQRQAERAAADLVSTTFGSVKHVAMDLLGHGKEGEMLSSIASRPIENSLGSSLLRAVEAAAPRGAEELVQAVTRFASTAIEAMAEGNLLKAASAAAPELPKDQPKTKNNEYER